MKRIIVEFFSAALLLGGIIRLCGCSEVEENYLPENCTETAEDEFSTCETVPVENQSPAAEGNSTKSDISKPEAVQTANVIPEPKTASAINGSTYTFSLDNVYSQGEYYTVSVTGEKRGGMFGDFGIVLSKDGAELSRLEINVPEGERFIILDSVAGGISYGCGIISNMRDFAAENYPDIIQLDFYKENELEIPQYGRYFAVFDGELTELDIYENGTKTEPRGTHPELRGKGRMVQHLCVYTPSGKSLMVEKYEYIFDLENRRLNRRKVDFLGWDVDN